MDTVDEYFELDKDIDPQKICRLCLSQTTDRYTVFSKSIVDGYMIPLPKILSYTLEIQVDPKDDKMPSKICSECKQLMISYYLFKKKTKRTENALQVTFGNSLAVIEQVKCSQCEQCFESEEDFDGHTQNGQCMITADNINLLDELDDVDKTNDDDHSQNAEIVFELADDDEISNDSTNNENEFTLPEPEPPAKRAKTSASSSRARDVVANKSVPKKRPTRKATTKAIVQSDNDDDDDFMAYVDEDDDDLFVDRDSTDDNDPLLNFDFLNIRLTGAATGGEGSSTNKGDLFCVPCNKKLRSSLQVEQHMKMHNAMSLIINYIDFYPCHECRVIFISGENLAAHMNERHQVVQKRSDGKKDSTSLERIDDSCTDYQFLEDDRDDNEYKEGSYACGDCELSFPTANELKYHVILHANKFKCPIFECGCQYNQLSRLSIHVINKHINAKLCQCLHCGKPFESFDQLQLHVKTDCHEKKFQCQHCEKKFYSKKALITHLRTIRVKKFECEACGKKFKQRGELVIHSRTHTNERPFQCTICSKTYKTSSMRAAHMDSHISGKTFECTLCDQKLQSRTSYRNHMKRHTEEKKHECDVCGKKFFTRYHQRLHASKVHVNVTNDDAVDIKFETTDIIGD